MARPGVSREILGKSGAVEALRKIIAKVAPTQTSVLVIGESGTGKELVARAIHDQSPRAGKPFVAINCGAIPENLIESELFGHRKRSFTGAVSEKQGLFEVAGTGTLFLDEIGELPIAMQVKLLRALQERVIRRVGGTDDIPIDVRIIAATNRDLEARVAAGKFREDLYYRLNVILIRAPSLRERPGDVEVLAEEFLRRFCERSGKVISGFAPEAMTMLSSHAWPGNIRELENVVERAGTLESLDRIGVASLPENVRNAVTVGSRGAGSEAGLKSFQWSQGELKIPRPDFGRGGIDLEEVLSGVERAFVQAALDHSGGVRKAAADLLGVTFRSIRYRLKKLGMDPGAQDDSTDE